MRYKYNGVNEIEDEQDKVDDTQEEEKSLQETQDNEDLYLINANKYKDESDNEKNIQNISNLNINLQESHNIGADIENTPHTIMSVTLHNTGLMIC
eukprot:15195320-Ditylum_brightwellii.AAC.1